MKFVNTQKYILTSPRKLRFVADSIRKMDPSEALQTLPYVKKRAAKPIYKALKTAVANATSQGVNEEDLILKEIQIGEGPRLKRGRPGARGLWKPYQRKMSHIRIVLEQKMEKKNEKKKEKRKTAVSKKPKKGEKKT
jgi:large subunit ribosomal protein L22